jgi:hypothetical protein
VTPQGYSLFKIVAAIPYNDGSASSNNPSDSQSSNQPERDANPKNGTNGSNGYVCCRAERRYSEFHALGQALARRLPGRSLHVLSYLPPKTCCRNMKIPFLERRRFSLELFLQQLVAEGPAVYQLNVVRRFLGVDVPMPMPLPMAESSRCPRSFESSAASGGSTAPNGQIAVQTTMAVAVPVPMYASAVAPMDRGMQQGRMHDAAPTAVTAAAVAGQFIQRAAGHLGVCV